MSRSDPSSHDRDDERSHLTKRDGERSEVSIPSTVKDAAGGSWQGEIENLSARGCRVKFGSHEVLEKGRAVTVSIRGIEAQGATVVWSKDGSAGFEFLHPLYEAVFENIARQYPAAQLVLSDTSDGWRSSDRAA